MRNDDEDILSAIGDLEAAQHALYMVRIHLDLALRGHGYSRKDLREYMAAAAERMRHLAEIIARD